MNEPGKPPAQTVGVESESGTEDFLTRWSQRKADVANQTAEPLVEETPEPEQAPLTDEDMPPLESLDQDSDYSGFFSPGVSENLRQLALSKLFRGPKFNITDGLNDYDQDYSKWVPLGDVVTCDMRFAMERAKEKIERALAELGEEPSAEAGLVADGEVDDKPNSHVDAQTDSDEPMTENMDEPGKP